MTRKSIEKGANTEIGSRYLPTIGLEIHAELRTDSKMFCSCKNDPDEMEPNINVCPICLGHPGTLPVLNKEAIKNVLKLGIAVEGKIADFTEWDRKQYFYPDIPKGYQISQYAYPLISGGQLAGVELERIHLEEDTAQSTHDTHEKSLVNFNRSGVPLMELVTKPVIHDAEMAVKFAKELQLTLRYLGAGEANMEKGEMRVEANISVAPVQAGELGTKTEVKNLNSFRAVGKAIEFEIERQIALLEKGDKVVQETRGWDDKKGETYPQRSKESAHDYRYFPDPDIPKMKISEIDDFSTSKLSEALPELPWQKRKRFLDLYGASGKEAEVFVENNDLAIYFDEIAEYIRSKSTDQKNLAESFRIAMNYFLTDYMGIIKKKGIDVSTKKINPDNWSELISMISNKEISTRSAKEILAMMVDMPDKSPKTIAQEHNLVRNDDPSIVLEAVKRVINENKAVVDEYMAGKEASIQYLIGQVMKITKGTADPSLVKQAIVDNLKH